jgi:hypothetical protein
LLLSSSVLPSFERAHCKALKKTTDIGYGHYLDIHPYWIGRMYLS